MKTFWNRPQLLNLKQIIQKILSNMIFIINILFNNNHLKENYFKHSVKNSITLYHVWALLALAINNKLIQLL